MGTSPSDSLPVRSYISSNSLSELRLLHIESSSDSESELEGEGVSSTVIMLFARGVGKLSLNGEAMADRDCNFWGGAARRKDTWGAFSIVVLRYIVEAKLATGKVAFPKPPVASVGYRSLWKTVSRLRLTNILETIVSRPAA